MSSSKENINKLIKEIESGKIKKDTLKDNTRFPLIDEFEAMYFKALRNFFKTSISYRIMTISQDVCEDEFIKKQLKKIK